MQKNPDNNNTSNSDNNNDNKPRHKNRNNRNRNRNRNKNKKPTTKPTEEETNKTSIDKNPKIDTAEKLQLTPLKNEKITASPKKTNAEIDLQQVKESLEQFDKKRNRTKDLPTENKPKIGITIGDLNGIGVEVIIKALSDSRMFDYCTPIIYGSSRVVSYHRKVLKSDSFSYNIISDVSRIRDNVCNIINCWNDEVAITFGRPNKNIGPYVLKAIESAMYDLNNNFIDAIITAPVNKHLLNTDQKPFTGHTEYITDKYAVDNSLMLLVSDTLKVGLVTNHLPVNKVSEAITEKLILEKLKIMDKTLRQDFAIIRPKIAVLSLNPHAGDNGLIGKEEEDVIIPTIEKAKNDLNIMAFGPYASDAFFGMRLYKKFDAVLAMYHDQGLIPFKALSFGHGVNFTAGLPVVRTSPDHGTAYDIAGKNLASGQSMREALFLTLDILRNRKQYIDMHKNKLKTTELPKMNYDKRNH